MSNLPLQMPSFRGQPQSSPQLTPSPITAAQPQTALPQKPAPQVASEPRLKIRMQAPEETPPAPRQRFALPPPEQLGIGLPTPAAAPIPVAIDWNVAKQRLDRLGAIGFHADRLIEGRFRVTILLPAGQGTHHIEAEAATEAAAVAFALERAEASLARK